MAGGKKDQVEGESKKSVSVTAAGGRIGELVNRVSYGGETILLTRYNKPVAKLVPIKAVRIPA